MLAANPPRGWSTANKTHSMQAGTDASKGIGQCAPPPPSTRSSSCCPGLRLPHMRRTASELLATAKARRWVPAEAVRALLAEELAGRQRSSVAARRKAAGFPTGQDLRRLLGLVVAGQVAESVISDPRGEPAILTVLTLASGGLCMAVLLEVPIEDGAVLLVEADRSDIPGALALASPEPGAAAKAAQSLADSLKVRIPVEHPIKWNP